ncbi:MAG: CRISPR system precrRNA processing endoribonuclease RAMP protein Cas6 [Lachnospiraceae bacterium]|nr:CRISPR system precrRNA processing endoribonuclease RAMP protein Cas6 [Lachnospiraceae bacterium]
MNTELEKALGVRYVALHFEIEMQESCNLPPNKASALRGGMGQMLIQSNCVRNKDCDNCDFANDCIVRRIMYSPFDIQPRFVSKGESAGYIITCQDYETDYEEGDVIEFQMTLFGKTIAYFNQILQALYQLGQAGLGEDRGRFAIIGVTNTNRETLLEGNNVYKERYQIRTLAEYVAYRLGRMHGKREERMLLHTPTAIKYNGQILTEPVSEAIVRTLTRRLLMLDCFEGIEVEQMCYDACPVITDQRTKWMVVKRYTSRQDKKLRMEGMRGWIDFEDIDDDLYALMLAGEIMHIGKHTSFGFGRYTMVEPR